MGRNGEETIDTDMETGKNIVFSGNCGDAGL